MSTGQLSYSFAAIAFAVLTALLLSNSERQLTGRLLILACGLSVIWATITAVSQSSFPVSTEILAIAELLRVLSWLSFLLSAAVPDITNRTTEQRSTLLLKALLMLAAFGIFTMLVLPLTHSFFNIPPKTVQELILVSVVAFSIFGLLLIEQVIRRAPENDIGTVKHLCIGLGALFVYDFFMFSDALLFKQLDHSFWVARGFVNGLTIPLIAISVVRNPRWSVRPHVSREVVLHSFAIVGTGSYLLAMAAAGYVIRAYDASWSNVLQVVFLSISVLLLLLLLFSQRMKAHIRVFFSKHFYSNKYDYRQEWLRFTKTLAEGSSQTVPERIISGLSTLIDSQGGALWIQEKQGGYSAIATKNFVLDKSKPESATASELDSLEQFLQSTLWLVDLDEYAEDPTIYKQLLLPEFIKKDTNAWLIIPLPFQDRLIGFAILGRSSVIKSVNWEDRDLLKLAGYQAAGLLAQYQTNIELAEAEQFAAFNKLSAYIVHDLKNILGQQSLIVSNAERHKSNPAFVDDVISTVENSVTRMTKLMEQLRSGVRTGKTVAVDLESLLASVVKTRSVQAPVPVLAKSSDTVKVLADTDRLKEVFNHIVQNAQEATDIDGSVNISLTNQGEMAIVTIVDNGSGMTDEFIQERLFRPFDSTKGLTGMGIGAYESREFIRALGGNISVLSEPGQGSEFSISIPAHSS